MICDIIESVARETVWRLRADSFQQLTRRSVPVPQSIIVYQHVQHLSYLTVELPRKSLGTLGKARLAKHRLGSQNSMHHDLEMIVTCDVRCVTGKTCCRLIEDINGVIFFSILYLQKDLKTPYDIETSNLAHLGARHKPFAHPLAADRLSAGEPFARSSWLRAMRLWNAVVHVISCDILQS